MFIGLSTIPNRIMQSSSNEAGDGDGTPSCMEYFARVEREATNPKCVECKMVTTNHKCTFICDGGDECGAPVCAICKWELFKKETTHPTRCSKHSFTYDTDSSSGLPSPRRLQDSQPPPPIANSQLPSEVMVDVVNVRRSPRKKNTSGTTTITRSSAASRATKPPKVQQICSHCQKNPTPKACIYETIDIPNGIYDICEKPICTSCKMVLSGPMGKYLCSQHATQLLGADDSDESSDDVPDIVQPPSKKPAKATGKTTHSPPNKRRKKNNPPRKSTPPTRCSPRKNNNNNSTQPQPSSDSEEASDATPSVAPNKVLPTRSTTKRTTTKKTKGNNNNSKQLQASQDLEEASDATPSVARNKVQPIRSTTKCSTTKKNKGNSSALLVPATDALINKAVAYDINSELGKQIIAQFSCTVSRSTLVHNHVVGTVSRKGKQKSGQLIYEVAWNQSQFGVTEMSHSNIFIGIENYN